MKVCMHCLVFIQVMLSCHVSGLQSFFPTIYIYRCVFGRLNICEFPDKSWTEWMLCGTAGFLLSDQWVCFCQPLASLSLIVLHCLSTEKVNLMGNGGKRESVGDQQLQAASWLMPHSESWETGAPKTNTMTSKHFCSPRRCIPPLDKALCGDEHHLCVTGSPLTDFVLSVLLYIRLLTGLHTVLWPLFALTYCAAATTKDNKVMSTDRFYGMFISSLQSIIKCF